MRARRGSRAPAQHQVAIHLGTAVAEREGEFLTATLNRQVEYQQRQACRRQVLSQITQSADWELPEELVMKQVENALHREILEMQQAGYSSREIQARELHRIEPDAHGVILNPEDGGLAYAIDPGQGVGDVDVGVVVQE